MKAKSQAFTYIPSPSIQTFKSYDAEKISLINKNVEIIPSILIYREKILWCFLGDLKLAQESQPARVRIQHK